MKMRQIFMSLIMALLLSGSSITIGFAEEQIILPQSFELISETPVLALYLDSSTTEIAVRDKRSGHIWYSNPPDRESAEKVAKGVSKEQLSSQFTISYYVTGDKKMRMNNFTDSVQHGQFDIQMVDNGVRIDYQLGKEWADEDYLPVIISQQRFNDLILSKVEGAKDQKLLLNNYELIYLVEFDGTEEFTIFGIDDLKRVLGGYTLASPEKELKPAEKKKLLEMLLKTISGRRKDIKERTDIKVEDLAQLRNNPTYVLKDKLWAWDIEDMIRIIRKTGYTPIDKQKDCRENHLDEPKRNIRVFRVPIIYRLEKDNFIVSIPADEIEYPIDVLTENKERLTLPLDSISVLGYFAAAGQGDDGYLFVPDGAGALINFNNGKLQTPAYQQPIYGLDYSTMPRIERVRIAHQNYLPVFGSKHDGAAVFAIIEDGEALARINADIAGRQNSYNTVSAAFNIIPVGQTRLRGRLADKYINIYQARSYKGDIRIRYAFLNGEDANYVGMARYYQEYLAAKHGMVRKNLSEDLPFILEVVGAVHRKEPVLGVPREVLEPLTTFSQAQNIVKSFKESGIDNIVLRYTGWLSGGLAHFYPAGARAEKALGDKREFVELRNALADNDVRFFPDVGFQYVHRDKVLDGFSPRRNGARFLNRKLAKVYDFDLATYQRDPLSFCYILSPRMLDSAIDSFLSANEELNIEGISLRYMGEYLNSDFRENQELLVDRQQAKEIIQAQLQRLQKQHQIMITGGNAYSLPSVEYIINQPLGASNYDLIDKGVPFMQIVLHGYVNYAGTPMNLDWIDEDSLLKHIECGMVPYYLVTYAGSAKLKETEFDYLYATDYRNWLEQGSQLYKKVSTMLQGLHNQRITNHAEIGPGVYQTTYETGDRIIVNYNDKPVEVGGVFIKRKSAVRVNGEVDNR